MAVENPIFDFIETVEDIFGEKRQVAIAYVENDPLTKESLDCLELTQSLMDEWRKEGQTFDQQLESLREFGLKVVLLPRRFALIES